MFGKRKTYIARDFEHNFYFFLNINDYPADVTNLNLAIPENIIGNKRACRFKLNDWANAIM